MTNVSVTLTSEARDALRSMTARFTAERGETKTMSEALIEAAARFDAGAPSAPLDETLATCRSHFLASTGHEATIVSTEATLTVPSGQAVNLFEQRLVALGYDEDQVRTLALYRLDGPEHIVTWTVATDRQIIEETSTPEE